METLLKKLEKKNKEELLLLIKELCDNNEDNVKYLKSFYSSKDNSEKHFRKIDRFLKGSVIRLKESKDYFNNIIKTTANKIEIAKTGIYYLESLIDVFEYSINTEKEYDLFYDVLDLTCSIVNKITCNEQYVKEIYDIICRFPIEIDCSDLFSVFYYYFEYDEE